MMNVGILGAGGIARKMAKTLNGMDQVKAYAIGSRSPEKARSFAQEYGMVKAYGSYEELVDDPDIALIYVASPHSHHAEHIRLALEHGKHVLCEKSFTVNERQAKEVINLAKEKNLLLAEAIWTRYLPMRKMLTDTISSGVIGEVRSLTANLGYVIDSVPRMREPRLAGGALLDVGIYTINFMLMVLGSDFTSFDTSVTFTETGVDGQSVTVFTYPGNILASLHSSQHVLTDRRGLIYGTRGYIEVMNINNPESIRVYDLDRNLVQELTQPKQITGFEYQVQACIESIVEGRIECPQMPHEEILTVMRTMDAIRAKWNFRYPME